jgi:hypothetical protein
VSVRFVLCLLWKNFNRIWTSPQESFGQGDIIYIDLLPNTATMMDQSQQTAMSIQPQQSSFIPDRQLRRRSTARGLDHTSTTLPREMPSSRAESQHRATSLSSGYQRRQSASVSVATSDSTENIGMETYQALAPTRTKTGRISKALKGRKVHRCHQCGKVAEIPYSHRAVMLTLI